MSAPPRTSPVDGRGARIVALLVAAAVAALLAYIKWDNFFPPERIASPEEAAFQHCMSERAAGIDEMVRQQAITAEQETLFRSRAEALCRAQAAPSSPGGTPPVGLPLPIPEQ
ncbi:MAG TPA: hypothetical protein VNB28_04965 [Methylomirabilota bacterium]|jgi:hypothetical protein|nr:hypothetical protein [Methylomirabilota bacterium]